MKSKEQKAEEYAIKFFPPKENSDPNAALRHTLEEVFIAGYNEAMRWRDPKKELPEPGVDVFVKIERKDGDWVNILYTTSAVVNDSFHNKDSNPFICEGYLTSIHSTSVYDGRVKITVIGWKPIE